MKKRIIAGGLAGIMLVSTLYMTACENADMRPSAGAENGADTEGRDDFAGLRREVSLFGLGPGEDSVADYNQNETILRLEERYDVDIVFRYSGWSSDAEAAENMFRKGDYCDVLYLNDWFSYKGGSDAAVADGVFWDLTDYVQMYMPNYYKLIHSDEEIRRLAYDDDGRISGLLVLPYDAVNQAIEEQMAVGGMIVRGDWLEESGMESPVTYQDWEEMLTLFRDKYGCRQPLYISGKGYATSSPGFSSGFGAIPDMQMNGDIVEYGPVTEGWKGYLTLMHDWYEKGLIGSEYITNEADFGIDRESCITEETGAMLCVWSWVDGIEQAISENADFWAVQFPVLEEGQTAQGGDPVGKLGGKSVFISTAVTEDELPGLLTMLDDFYDTETAFELAYGMEGDTYTLNKEGKPEFTDKILHNPEGIPFGTSVDSYLMPVNYMLLKDWSRELNGISEENLEMCRIWDRDGHDLYVPPVILSAAEQETYDVIMEDVEDYVEEMSNKMIVGAVDIESTWPSYIQTLEDMGIREAVAACQAAYNRYVHR